MRILMVGPGNNGKYGGAFYYAFHRRLMNGFVRAGHFVFAFSDRDTADYALGVRALGRHLANKRLIEVAKELQPDVLLFLQSDLISPQSVETIRRLVSGIKVGTISIDDIGHPRPAEQFRRLLCCSDYGFATTGGGLLQSFASLAPVAFVPNPVDLSIDTNVSYERVRHDYDYFFAGHQPEVDKRWEMIRELKRCLGDRARPLVGGIFGKSQRQSLSGAAYVKALGRAKVGLNFNRRDGDLYASDRMAQYLGNGLLLASARRGGFDKVFDEEEMLFFDTMNDLAQGLERVLHDDKLWRVMARAGREKALKTMRDTVVADFILGMLMGEGAKEGWSFSSHVFMDEIT